LIFLLQLSWANLPHTDFLHSMYQILCPFSFCLQWGVLSPTPNPQAGGPPIVGCPWLLIHIFAATLHI
jgi:hypothetical protein